NAESKMSIGLSLRAGEHHVKADPGRIQQVFWNLLSNAVKFTPAGGRIRVRTWNEGDSVVSEVADTGAGIEPALLPKLFNAFEQGAVATERKTGGLGLGLAISKALIVAHGGSLTAHSDGLGTGSTFIVRLQTVAPLQKPAPGDDRA